jgi:hypothetical protein
MTELTVLIEVGLGSIAPVCECDIVACFPMGERHGAVDPLRGILLVREDVDEGMADHRGRDRFTGGHEVGHVLLHGGSLNGVKRANPSGSHSGPGMASPYCRQCNPNAASMVPARCKTSRGSL